MPRWIQVFIALELGEVGENGCVARVALDVAQRGDEWGEHASGTM
jgi:hypothetical protein